MVAFSPSLAINGSRLLDRLDQLASIGQLPAGGVCRIAFSPEDQSARRLVQEWMQAAGMAVRIDAAGNIIGRSAGSQPELPALATGSHIDTVPTGGRYDGCYGVLAGLEVVQTCKEQGLSLRHPVEVIVFTDEEGSLIGSQAISGTCHADPEYYRRLDGSSIQSCLAAVGGHWDTLATAQRTPQDYAAFVELHVEQGPVLETAGKSIGVVSGIVGQRRKRITITGRANHAGTTPMPLRQDALVAASQVVLAVHHLGVSPGDHVATVGQLQVFPNAANVVPGRVEMSLDIRDLSTEHLDALVQQWQQELVDIAARTQTTITMDDLLHTDPAPAAPHIQEMIAAICEAFHYTSMTLPSRASHDAQEMARIAPMGMIFVPSQCGVSHDESEYTTPEDCVQGANVLLHTLLSLDALTSSLS